MQTFLVLIGSVIALSHAPALSAQQAATPATSSSTRDIDRDVWKVVVETVEKDDIVRMGSSYRQRSIAGAATW